MTDVNDSVAALAAPDPQQRTLALAALVQAGRAATGPLVEALNRGDGFDEAGRRLAAQALAELADPAAEAAYRSLLDDPDPTVRGRGAQGLAAVGAPDAAAALADTIDALPDLLHHPQTVATLALVARGWSAAPAVAGLLEAGDPTTRERAVLVLRQLDPGDPRSAELRTALGAYANADEQTRAEAARRVVAVVGPG